MSKHTLHVKDNIIYCIAGNTSTGIVVAEHIPIKIEDPIPQFNIDLARLQKGITCARTPMVCEFTVDTHKLSYQDNYFKFSIPLLKDSVMTKAGVRYESIKSWPFETEIVIAEEVLRDIKRASNFASDTEKFYVEEIDGNIHFYFGDKTNGDDHQNAISIVVSNTFSGKIKSAPYNKSILEKIEKLKEDIVLKIGGVCLALVAQNEKTTLTYLTTQLKN